MNQKTKCPCCERLRIVKTHRRLTQYADDTLNWLVCCSGCIEVDNLFYNEAWRDYYKSQGIGGYEFE